MPIQVRCPQGHRLAVADKYAGRRVTCPKCHAALAVPAAKESSSLVASPPPAGTPASQVSGGRSLPKPPPIPKPPVAAPPVAAPMPPPAPVVATAVPPPSAEPGVLPKLRVWSGEGVRGYRPEASRVHTVYLLAVGIVLLICLQLAPAASQFNPATAPNWVRCLLMLTMIQLAYAIWMVSFPDWSTVRTMMFTLAAVATLYGVALGIATVTPREKSLPFDLNDVRNKVQLWCGAVLLLLGLLTYACGRIAFRWRKAYRALLAV